MSISPSPEWPLLDEPDETLDGVFKTHHRFPLFALAVDGDRVASNRLRAEAVDDGK